jgi:sugar O-acyltransferase (sialic acid O-acetyltransferase NeuD family)
MEIALIGAGGHAKMVAETLAATGHRVVAYCDRRAAPWLDAQRIDDDARIGELPAEVGVALGVGGIDPAGLARRRLLLDTALAGGRRAPAIIHPSAIIGRGARLAAGAQVLAGAIVQPGASIGVAAIVNSGALVEHDSEIGDGTHVCPRAIVLADCRVGSDCMIGAAAVILPGNTVPPGTLVPALTRYPR